MSKDIVLGRAAQESPSVVSSTHVHICAGMHTESGLRDPGVEWGALFVDVSW